MSKLLKEEIISGESNRRHIPDDGLSDYISANAEPGQFVNIKCCEGCRRC